MKCLCVLCASVVPLMALAGTGDQKAPRVLPPFLEEFKVPEKPVVAKDVVMPSASGPRAGFMARPASQEQLPAVLLLGPRGLDDWIKTSAREMAGIGYVTLAVDVRPRSIGGDEKEKERALAEAAAAVRWLRGREDVRPGQIGVVAWKGIGEIAVALAGTTALQACVICDLPPVLDAGAVQGLRRTPFLGLFASADPTARQSIASFRTALKPARQTSRICSYEKVEAGFMNPSSKTFSFDDAEDAWVQMYEFLGKHVEDAGDAAVAAPAEASKTEASKAEASKAEASKGATIADIMRAVNQPTGVRGRLIAALDEPPTSEKQWQNVRANAALMVEAGRLLQHRSPSKGSAAHWLQMSKDYTASAEEIVTAADRKDEMAARHGLERLGQQCAKCHRMHR